MYLMVLPVVTLRVLILVYVMFGTTLLHYTRLTALCPGLPG